MFSNLTTVKGAKINGVQWANGSDGVDRNTNTLQMTTAEHSEIHDNYHYVIEDFQSGNFENTNVLDFCFKTANSLKKANMVFSFEAVGSAQLDIYEAATVTADTGALIVQRGNNRSKCYVGGHSEVSASATIMTDGNASFTPDALIGWKIYNVTDGSFGIITDNDATTVTVSALTGGSGNNWETGDKYEINTSLTEVRLNSTITDVGHRLGGQSGGDATNPNQGVPGGSDRDKELVLRPDTWYVLRFTSGVNGNVLTYDFEWYERSDKNT